MTTPPKNNTDTHAEQGQVFIICGASGTGKSTLVRRLAAQYPAIAFSVSYTTRPPRPGETDGVHYHFVDQKTFLRLRDEGAFAEWAEVHGNYYATPLKDTLEMLDAGRDVFFDIDVQGARQLKSHHPEGCYLFLFPPSYQELVNRLESRKTESREIIERRMANAREELRHAGEFGFWIVNDDLDEAYDALRAVYKAERLRRRTRPWLAGELLSQWPDQSTEEASS